ncbi:hypothetical protein [Dokdonella immobilis]|uniref:Uncharacterized protein n=1 Tax=Dokdonella immobilis TaxID=578942 RepID=A0A1I4WSQ0_9GAMM|nr:hypothetical protein [Dokdonella immobilis]SFN16844.1 hypothetical protein SAMN05216289_10630 [Dokdonella immobilis]
MANLRMRLTASEDDTAALINRIAALQGVESVEEIADLMPHMDDPDSSSAGLPDDIGPGSHLVLVEAGNETGLRRALEVAEACAHAMAIGLEVEDPSD